MVDLPLPVPLTGQFHGVSACAGAAKMTEETPSAEARSTAGAAFLNFFLILDITLALQLEMNFRRS